MSFFDRKPQVFQLLFALALILLISIAGASAYRYASSATDENWFKDPQGNLYVTQSLPAIERYRGTRDSIRAGDLLISVNRTHPWSVAALKEILAAQRDSIVTVGVQRLSEDRYSYYRIPAESLVTVEVRELPPTAFVFDVIEGGASDRAGMKEGDLILRINGRSFRNVLEADRIMREAQAGKTVEYEILRDNATMTLQVTLASFGMPFGFLSMLLGGMVFIGTGVFLGFARPRIKAARLLAFFFLTLGFALSLLLIRNEIERDALFYARITLVPLMVLLAIPVLLHASHYFPRENPELLRRRWIRITAYLLLLLIVPLVIAFGTVAFVAGLAVLLVYALITALFYKRLEPAETKAIMRPLRWVGLAALGLNVLSLVFLFVSRPKPAEFPWWLIGITTLSIPLTYLYIIGRHRLLDLDIRLRRSFQYLAVATLWRLCTFALFLWLLSTLVQWKPEIPDVRVTEGSFEILESPPPPERQELLQKGIILLGALSVTAVFWVGGRAGLGLIARLFHRTRYDYRRAVAELSEVMATRLSMKGLARGTVEKVTALMQLKRAGVLFFRGEGSSCCQEAHCQEIEGFDQSVWREFCMNSGSAVAASLRPFKGEISIDYLPEPVKQEFRRNGFQIVIPIRSKERLIGALLVGEKQSEQTYRQEDFEFLAAAARQASVAIENAFLYEELAEQERIKHELAIARRIQLDSLPQTIPAVEGLDVAGSSIPALEVGGDYFDYLNGALPRLTIVVGDVSGKGTSAALYMSKVQGILRSLHGFGLDPRELFVRANKLLYGDLEKRSFVTAIGAAFDTERRRIVVARAGHLPLFCYRAASGTVERLVPRGIGLGLESGEVFDPELELRAIDYQGGDVFLFVTDGITDAHEPHGEQFGEQRLEAALQASAPGRAADVRDTVFTAVADFTQGAGQIDDQTVVVVKAL